MKRQKRDRIQRAHHKGYTAGINGKSSNSCPFTSIDFKEQWLGGWREAKEEVGKGYFT